MRPKQSRPAGGIPGAEGESLTHGPPEAEGESLSLRVKKDLHPVIIVSQLRHNKDTETKMAQIIPIRDLKDTNAISARCHEVDEPIYVTKNGYGDMVIMSMKVYEEKLDAARILSALAVAENDIRSGNVNDAFDVLKETREKYGI